MILIKLFLAGFILQLLGCSNHSQSFSTSNWEHVSIDSMLPGSSWGTGGFTLADFDSDRDLDITINRRVDSGNVYWYENQSGIWEQHFLGVADLMQLGAVASDIDNDGFPDLVVARFWFENPGVLDKYPDSSWTRHIFAGGLKAENHDITAHDFNRDGRKEILCYSQSTNGGTIRVYNTSDPYHWTYQDVASNLNEIVRFIPQSNGQHGGFAPAGTNDLDKDGYADIVMPGGWYKNPGKNGNISWQYTPWPFQIGIIPNLYGLSMRSWIVDLDLDSDNDIVYTDCDVESSRGYWIENRKKGKVFIRHELPSPGIKTGSFHSLNVSDFDNDGDKDIFTGEQEDPDIGMKPPGLKERGIFWENTGNRRHPVFVVRIIHTDNPGWHDVQAGDVDGDGDIDIVSKIWNKDGSYYHTDLWVNKLIH